METTLPEEHRLTSRVQFKSGTTETTGPVKGRIPKEDFNKMDYQTPALTGRFALKLEPLPVFKFPSTKSLTDPRYTMKALVFQGKENVAVIDRPRVMVTDPGDAVIRITSTTICGSDLHMYHNEVPGMEPGDVLGHECMGIVHSIGENVKNLRVGDRVVVSAVIADGTCFYCQAGLYSLCEGTNPSKEMEELYGHRIAGVFGYSHLTGGYEGGQAEFIRVPIADFNCLKVPDELPDEKVLFLSDIACTGWHATELGGVIEGNTVAIWGCGPVGLMAGMWCKFRGAAKIVMIDHIDYRLRFAQEKLGVDVIDFSTTKVRDEMKRLIPHGPDVAIDCVGFRFPKTLLHKLQKTLYLETDVPEVLEECITCVRKGGSVSIIGDYFLKANNFPIGAAMEKGLMSRGAQVFVHKYWKQLLGYIQQGLVDPSFVITHVMPLERAAEGYRMFDQHEDDVIKILLKPSLECTVRVGGEK